MILKNVSNDIPNAVFFIAEELSLLKKSNNNEPANGKNKVNKSVAIFDFQLFYKRN